MTPGAPPMSAPVSVAESSPDLLAVWQDIDNSRTIRVIGDGSSTSVIYGIVDCVDFWKSDLLEPSRRALSLKTAGNKIPISLN